MLRLDDWRDGWERADKAAEALKEALTSLGVPRTAHGVVRPVVTRRGGAYVDLGMVRADVVVLLVEALSLSAPVAPRDGREE
ncbi:hypothetical protein [Streptomyces sp. NPDC047928]|uniref:hypothetical protein n=1 Tax=unclassified Streptomyces TaxID=2593676 RepID=UPI0037168FEB